MSKKFTRRITRSLLILLSFYVALLSPFTVLGESKSEEISYPLTLKDMAEREITLEEEPQTVVSLGPNMTELVFALGAGDRLVGRTTYCDYPEEALEVEEVGSLMEPDLEKITELDPDLILASTHVEEETLDKFTELDIPVIMLYDEENLSGLEEIINLLGQALNLPAAGTNLAHQVMNRIDQVKMRYQEAEKISTYYVVGFGESGDFTAGGNTFINDMIEIAGGENIAADIEGWSMSVESLIEADPEVIIIPDWAKDSFGQEEPYSKLTAVKEDRVYAVDNNLFDRQGPRNALGVEKLASLLAGARIKLRAEETDYPVTLKDISGKKVSLEEEPQTVVSLGPNMTELIFALGAGDRLIGRTSYCDYPEEALEVTEVGTLLEPDFEKIAELDPDLVLASTHVSEETLDQFKELKIPVLMLYDEKNLGGLGQIILTLGKALNLNEKAAELEKDTFDRIQACRPEPQIRTVPTIYYVVGFGESGDFTAGGNTFIDDIIEAAGGQNIATDVEGWSYAVEKLIEADPDLIILPAWAEESFGKETPYNKLTAVKEDHIAVVDNNIFDRQGPRNAEAVETLQDIIEDYLAEMENTVDDAA